MNRRYVVYIKPQPVSGPVHIVRAVELFVNRLCWTCVNYAELYQRANEGTNGGVVHGIGLAFRHDL